MSRVSHGTLQLRRAISSCQQGVRWACWRTGESRKVVRGAIRRGLLVVPALAVAAGADKRPAAVSLSFDRDFVLHPGHADPRLAAAFAGRAPSRRAISSSRPPPPRAGRRRSASRSAPASTRRWRCARSSAVVAPMASALTPASYNLGVAVGWRRFAVAGDVAKTSSADPALGGRESAVVGVSYIAQELHRPGRASAPSAATGAVAARSARPTMSRSMSAAPTR